MGVAPLAIWQDALLAAGLPAPALLGFRDAAHAEGAGLLANATGRHRRRLGAATTAS